METHNYKTTVQIYLKPVILFKWMKFIAKDLFIISVK